MTAVKIGAVLLWAAGHAPPTPTTMLPTTMVHPVDGPDLDLRIEVTTSHVTLHAIFNLAFLDELMPMARADEYALAESEQPAMRECMFAWLKLNHTVRVDGVAVTPTLAAFAVDPGDPRLLPMFPLMGSKALIRARFALQYKALQAPRSVNLRWQAYPPNLQLSTARARVFAEVQGLLIAAGTEQVITLRQDEPEFTWHAPSASSERLLPVPAPVRAPDARPSRTLLALLLLGWGAATWLVVRVRLVRPALAWATSAVLLGAAIAYRQVAPKRGGAELPTPAQAAAIFAPLHANLYRAFDYTEPTEVYDALARSVDGTLLDAVYADIYQSLVMAEEGGAVSRVKAVRPLQVDVERIGTLDDGRTPSFTVNARWQVDGSVFHWGHQHWRTNEQRARYTVIATDAGWRIAGTQALAQTRIEAGPGLPPPSSGEANK